MRLSVPSYVIPGTYLENVIHIDQFAAVDNIELLFFAFDPDTEELYRRERKGLQGFLGRFTYSLHMPDAVSPEYARLIDETADLVSRYIIHPPKGDLGEFVSLMRGWIECYGQVFLIENVIDRPIEAVLPEIPGLGVCIDTGHALIDGVAPGDLIRAHADLIQEIHLHGVKEGKDHHSFAVSEAWFQDIIPDLERLNPLVHLEAFAEDRVRSMMAELRTAGLLEERT